MREESSGGGSSVFTPPEGSPDAIRSSAKEVGTKATAVGDLGGDIRHNRVDDNSWEDSHAGLAYFKRADTLEEMSAHIEHPLERMVQALNSYADCLDSAQRKIKEAKQRFDGEQAASTDVIDKVNANPSRTPEQVKAAEAASKKHADAAQEAEDDASAAWDAYNVEAAGISETLAEIAAELAKGTPLEDVAKAGVAAAKAQEKIAAEGPKGEKGEGEEGESPWLIFNEVTKIALDSKDAMGLGVGFLGRATNYGMFKKVEDMTKNEKAAWKDAKKMYEGFDKMLEGGNWKEGPKEWFKEGPWSKLVKGVEDSEDAAKEAGKAAEEAGKTAAELGKGVKGLAIGADVLGKVLGPVAIVTGGVETGNDLKHHEWASAYLDGAGAALTAGAIFSPPPADVICGVGALGVLGEKALYEHVPAIHHFVDHTINQDIQGAKNIGHGISKAWHAIF